MKLNPEELKEVVDYSVMGILLFMSVLSFAVFLERLYTLKKINIFEIFSKKELELILTKRLYILATVATNAPYVGLLGTVLGILLTFYSIGERGFKEPKEIMEDLALALKATALGLLVAIPSSIFYNYLLRKVKEKIYLWEIDREKLYS